MQISYLFSIPLIPNQKSLLHKKKILGVLCVCICVAKNSKSVCSIAAATLLTGACLLMYQKILCLSFSCVCLSIMCTFIYIVCGCAMYIQNIRLIGDIFKIMSLHSDMLSIWRNHRELSTQGKNVCNEWENEEINWRSMRTFWNDLHLLHVFDTCFCT